ncbi:MAG: hypothetical protein KDA93_07710 [Planctomycetaceae bacterium]|nr:hypothetical protein [Planctomycetaceae bacterium]
MTAGLTLAIAAGVVAAWTLRERLVRSPFGRYAISVSWLTIAVWSVAYPWMLSAARNLFAHVPTSWLTFEATTFVLMLLASLTLFGMPTMVLTWIGQGRALHQPRCRRHRFAISTRSLVGCGLALGAAPLALASWTSIESIGYLITGLASVGFWITLTREAIKAPLHSSATSTISDESSLSRQQLAFTVGTALLTGAAVPLASRLVLQFLPGSGYESYALCGGFVCGTACGFAGANRLHRRKNDSLGRDAVLTSGIISAVWPTVLLLLSPLLLGWTLSLNATVDTVPLLIAARWSFGFFVLFPLGIAIGRLCSHRAASSTRPDPVSVVATTVCFAAGIVLVKSLWVSLASTVLLTTIAAVALSTARLWKSERVVPRRTLWITGSLCVAALGLLPVSLDHHRPDLCAKLLFSGQSFGAYNSGMERDLLPHIDDGRLMTVSDGRDAVWTVWKHRGSQIHLRQNGIPAGIVSTEPLTCPQFPGDMMQAVVPLVVHPQPDRVLVVGLGSTAAVTSCLACPVRQVTCVEGDAELIRINDEIIATASGFNPLDDDRLVLRHIDPTLGLMSAGETYDVVLLTDSHPSLMRQSSRFTREYYENAARHLNPGGIVSQRFQYADFGRTPIETALATMRSVFPQVACIESAPGEIVLLASNTEETMFDESMFERCEADHFRRLLAEQGWDWSVLFNLSAISPEEISEITKGDVAINTNGNGYFTYRLPQEVMRWGLKWREIAGLFAEHGSRMLAWVGESDEIPEIGKRLKDMEEQHRLIVEHPDRWHAYRATLKSRLQERPRSAIMQVNHELERVLHPEDQRRKDYLKALGQAATREAPTSAEIAELAEFIEPYDPLVSYFLHEEAAHLYERSESPDRRAQLAHLRHSVHFSPGQDQSVRNVVAALQLLLDEPELVTDPQQRWDEMNALLDVLRQRSALRVQTDKTASSFELLDAENSIKVAERAMEAMDELHIEAGVSASDWEHRRTILDRLLVRPMWTYHSRQAQRLATIEAQLKRIADQESEEDQTITR